MVFDASGTGDVERWDSGRLVSNGTYTPGTLLMNLTHAGVLTIPTASIVATLLSSPAGNTLLLTSSDQNGVTVEPANPFAAVAAGSALVQGGTSSSATYASGNASLVGGTNSNSGAAGNAIVQGGYNSSTGNHGLVLIESVYIKGTTVTANYLECITSDDTVGDCGASPVGVVGIALTTAAPIHIQTHGQVLVASSASASVGQVLCATTTAGKGTPSSSACATGTGIGTVVSISKNGASATLPLVELHITN